MKLQTLDNVFITSDTHAFHKNICKGVTSWDSGATRDFEDQFKMTEALVENFNKIIPQNATLIHLGDWSFGGRDNIQRFRDMLHVNSVHIITGNHDHHIETGDYDYLFASRNKYLELNVEGYNLCLFHFKIHSWNNVGKGWLHFHGHHHWSNDLKKGLGKSMDVGVDGNNLLPYSLVEAIDEVKYRVYKDEMGHHI